METIRLSFDTGIRDVEVNNYGDVIKINTTDAGFFDRFVRLTTELQELSDKSDKEFTSAMSGQKEDKTGAIIKASRVRVEFSNECIRKIEDLLGIGAISKVFKDCYEADPDYIPDEGNLLAFLEALIPIMEELFKDRFTRLQSKYSVNFKGKRTKKK